jgi:Ni2+-binding GTPase involved in maturation of urease and hydrogenase
MKINLVSGFLGSGKTTAIERACRELLAAGVRVGVITNDQGERLVDGEFFESLGIPNRQVTNGCFCCNYNQLDDSIQLLLETVEPEVIFAEAVGSCTDMVATVMKPLQIYRNDVSVTVSVLTDVRVLYMQLRHNTLLFDESVNYIYYKQLEEAGIIVVNKIDLIDAGQLADIRRVMQQKYPDKIVLYQDSLAGGGVGQWMEAMACPVELSSLEIEYAIYGAGEALLAWLDQEVVVVSPDGRAALAAIALTRRIDERIRECGYPIGHLKFLLDGKTKISYTALAAEVAVEVVPAGTATLLINARVQTEPAILAGLVAAAIGEIEAQYGCTLVTKKCAAFQPGFPKPTHRR